MINWQSILSSFDDKPTLLEWLKKVQKALNESALTTVTVTQEKAGRVNSITLSFNFQDGTKIVAPAFTVNDGADGADGVGITDITNTSLSAGKITATYDTTDGITVFADMQQDYKGGQHVSKVDYTVPLMPGNGIVIDKKANAEKVVIKIDKGSFKTIFGNQSVVGSGNIDLYLHNIVFKSSDPDKIVKIRFIVPSSNNLEVNSLTDLKTLLGNTFTYPVNGANSTNNQSIYEITETGYKSGTSGYVLYDTVTAYPTGTWTDNVKTI